MKKKDILIAVSFALGFAVFAAVIAASNPNRPNHTHPMHGCTHSSHYPGGSK